MHAPHLSCIWRKCRQLFLFGSQLTNQELAKWDLYVTESVTQQSQSVTKPLKKKKKKKKLICQNQSCYSCEISGLLADIYYDECPIFLFLLIWKSNPPRLRSILVINGRHFGQRLSQNSICFFCLTLIIQNMSAKMDVYVCSLCN